MSLQTPSKNARLRLVRMPALKDCREPGTCSVGNRLATINLNGGLADTTCRPTQESDHFHIAKWLPGLLFQLTN